MAAASIAFLLLAFVLIILVILFIAGLILLIAGIVNKCSPKNRDKKFPVVLIAVGALLLALPVGTAAVLTVSGVTSAISTGIMRTGYENITDQWRNERITDNGAADGAINELLSCADSGDRERFAKTFTPDIQRSAGFDGYIDEFFAAYPAGLSGCELENGGVGSESSYDCGHNVKTGSTFYTCVTDGEWYRINLEFCFENTDSPDGIGVTFFSVENLEASALDTDYEDRPLVCSIKSEKEVSARLIGNNAFLFEPTPERVITEEELREYLSECDDLDSLSQKIGKPNVTKKYDNCTGYDNYYELAPENGEPRYAYLCTDSPTGRFLYSYICSDKESMYDEGILPGE